MDFKLSELRVVELLDGLCSRMNDYALWTPSDEWRAGNPEGEAGSQWVKISGSNRHAEGAKGA